MLQGLREEARALVAEMEQLKAVGAKPDGSLIMSYDFRQSREALDRVVEEAETVLADLHGRGCRLKDIDRGLVDFPAIVEGEEVLLCWQMGEPEVSHYHGLEDGFSGRRHLPMTGWTTEPADDEPARPDGPLH